MKLSVIFFLLFFSASLTNAQNPIVNVKNGPIEGFVENEVYKFLGIPFASAPVGDLRWKKPYPHSDWDNNYIADNFPPACPQKRFEQGDTVGYIEGDEDCLYLNVWSPDINGEFPVMVFIHGGGNQQGSSGAISGGTHIYDGSNLANRGEVVVVTIQYRLGPLGFLVHPGLEAEAESGKAGNYAVMDQIMALTWIQENIEVFGGNPENVTIFGESAGGVNVGNLMASPKAQGLFQRAIIQSASAVVAPYQTAKSKGEAYVDSLVTGTNALEKIAKMRQLPVDSLIKSQTNPLKEGIAQMNWQPALDNFYFEQYPIEAFRSGEFNHVPLIIGSNADEMSLSAPPIITPQLFKIFVNSSFPGWSDEIFALYPPGNTNDDAWISYVGLLTDGQFTSTTRRVAQCVSLNQPEPAWRYFFTYEHSIEQLKKYGSYHGMELFYVFNNWESATLGKGVFFRPSDDSLQKNLLNYWVNFAYTGNPNGAGLVEWPRYNSSEDNYLEINATPVNTKNFLRKEKCDLMDEISGFSSCLKTNVDENDIHPKNLQISPNPASEYIEVNPPFVPPLPKGDAEGRGISDIKIYNTFGECLVNYELPMTNYDNTRIDISHLPIGLYFIQIGNYSQKFMVVR